MVGSVGCIYYSCLFFCWLGEPSTSLSRPGRVRHGRTDGWMVVDWMGGRGSLGFYFFFFLLSSFLPYTIGAAFYIFASLWFLVLFFFSSLTFRVWFFISFFFFSFFLLAFLLSSFSHQESVDQGRREAFRRSCFFFLFLVLFSPVAGAAFESCSELGIFVW